MNPSYPPAPIIFPPIKQLFKDSWDNLISKLLQVFIFNAIGFGLGLAGAIILFLIILGLITFSGGNSVFSSIVILILSILWLIVVLIWFFVFQIGNILVLSNNTNQISYKNTLKRAFSLIIPVASGQLLVALIVLGGFFLFIIPGIIFSIFLQFVIYLIVLDGVKVKDSLKRSAFIVSKSFGQIFIRLLLLYLIPYAVSVILSIVSEYNLEDSAYGIINGLFSIAYSFFAISYSLTLFKQAKAAAGEGLNNIRFLGLISLIGWILMIAVAFFSFSFLGSLVNQGANSLAPADLSGALSEDEIIIDDEELLSTPSATNTPALSASQIPISTNSASQR